LNNLLYVVKKLPASNAAGQYEKQNLNRETIFYRLPDFFFIFLCVILIMQ